MIRIITDSAADFEPAELARRNILCIPMNVRFRETDYQENVNLTKTEFYGLLAGAEELPKSSQPSPQHLLALFQEAKEAGDEAIYITLSSAISGTYQTALMALDMAEFPGGHVLDSRNATGGQRILVEYAVKLRDAGASVTEILDKVGALRDRIVLYACIDTLEYLYKGGRISHTAYTLGSLAQIKPVIQVTQEGTIAVPAKAMGIRKGMDLLCKRLSAQEPDPDFPLYVMYTSSRAPAEALAEKLRKQGYSVPDEHIIGVGAAIGTHIGPDACGIVYVEKA